MQHVHVLIKPSESAEIHVVGGMLHISISKLMITFNALSLLVFTLFGSMAYHFQRTVLHLHETKMT